MIKKLRNQKGRMKKKRSEREREGKRLVMLQRGQTGEGQRRAKRIISMSVSAGGDEDDKE